jgi:hypothetical protein
LPFCVKVDCIHFYDQKTNLEARLPAYELLQTVPTVWEPLTFGIYPPPWDWDLGCFWPTFQSRRCFGIKGKKNADRNKMNSLVLIVWRIVAGFINLLLRNCSILDVNGALMRSPRPDSRAEDGVHGTGRRFLCLNGSGRTSKETLSSSAFRRPSCLVGAHCTGANDEIVIIPANALLANINLARLVRIYSRSSGIHSVVHVRYATVGRKGSSTMKQWSF